MPDDIGFNEYLTICMLAVIGVSVVVFVLAAVLRESSKLPVRVKWSGPYRVGGEYQHDGASRELVEPADYRDCRRPSRSSRRPRIEPAGYDSNCSVVVWFGIALGIVTAVIVTLVVVMVGAELSAAN